MKKQDFSEQLNHVKKQINIFLFEIADSDNKQTKVYLCEQLFDFIILDNRWLLEYSPIFKAIVEEKLKNLKKDDRWTKSNFYLREMTITN